MSQFDQDVKFLGYTDMRYHKTTWKAFLLLLGATAWRFPELAVTAMDLSVSSNFEDCHPNLYPIYPVPLSSIMTEPLLYSVNACSSFQTLFSQPAYVCNHLSKPEQIQSLLNSHLIFVAYVEYMLSIVHFPPTNEWEWKQS